MDALQRIAKRFALFCCAIGIGILVIQAFWITYAVFLRYVLDSPARMTTEATTLLLVPLAFLGLALAFHFDTIPKVTVMLDSAPHKIVRLLERVNTIIIVAVGTFFAIVTIKATIATYHSGASSTILGWPQFFFWAPTAAALIAFVLFACIRLFTIKQNP